MRCFIKILVVTACALTALLRPVPGLAISKCTAKISTSDGTISVSGMAVGGTVRWGASSGTETNAFANEAACIENGKAGAASWERPGRLPR